MATVPHPTHGCPPEAAFDRAPVSSCGADPASGGSALTRSRRFSEDGGNIGQGAGAVRHRASRSVDAHQEDPRPAAPPAEGSPRSAGRGRGSGALRPRPSPPQRRSRLPGLLRRHGAASRSDHLRRARHHHDGPRPAAGRGRGGRRRPHGRCRHPRRARGPCRRPTVPHRPQIRRQGDHRGLRRAARPPGSRRPHHAGCRDLHRTLGHDPRLFGSGPRSRHLPGTASQSSLERGQFFEQGALKVLERLAPAVATPERLRSGLAFKVDY